LAEIVGLVNVCTAEMVGLIGEALATGAWQGLGIRSPEHWVTWKCGVSPTRAHRLVGLARGLGELPETRRVFRTGALSEDQTAVVVRHTDSAHDASVAALATSLTVPQLTRVLPSVPRPAPQPAPAGDHAAGDNLNETPGDNRAAGDGAGHAAAGDNRAAGDGTGHAAAGDNRATGEDDTTGHDGAGHDTAGQDSAADQRPAGDSAGAGPPGAGTPAGRDLGTRRYVAMGYGDDGGFWCSIRLPGDEGALLERGLTQARHVEFHQRHPDADDDARVETRGVSWADALLRLVETGLTGLDPATTTGRPPSERTQVILHLDADRATPPRLHLGPVVPPAIADHLSCDATVRYLLLRDGTPLAKGRRQRTVAPGLRIIIEQRDHTCRVPGCGHHRWLHIHHLIHWTHGGPTDPANLLALCPTHHRMVHKGLLTITGDPNRPDGLRFHDNHGRQLLPARPQPPPPDTPPTHTATAYGLPDPGWNHPPGEPLDTRWITWD
jgi:hypothetical protein